MTISFSWLGYCFPHPSKFCECLTAGSNPPTLRVGLLSPFFSVFWSFCPSIFPFVAYPTCLAVQRFLVMSLCLCNTLHTLPSFYLFFGPSLVLHNPLSLSYSIILLPSSVQFPSFFSSLCFVLHFTSHESRCYFFFLLCMFSSLFQFFH